EYPTPKTIEFCIRHYMNCKVKEYSDEIKVEELDSKMRSVYQKLKGIIPDEISHCIKWIDVLNNVSS
nr:hypothetical protein [Ignavibacteria bacterium]